MRVKIKEGRCPFSRGPLSGGRAAKIDARHKAVSYLRKVLWNQLRSFAWHLASSGQNAKADENV